MWFKIKSYLFFLLNSTNQHGVHSPFVYNFVTKCLYKKPTTLKVDQVNTIRNWLSNNHKIIDVSDFGNGSKVFKTNKRRVSDIAKIAGMSKKKASLLISVVEYFNPQTMLEIGTSVGLGSATLSISNPKAEIYTLEGCENTSNVALDLFKKFQLNNMNLIVGNFDITLSEVIGNQNFDFIYFDGNHQKEATLKYFNQCLQTAHNSSIFIFDDINLSYKMEQAWSAIKNHPKVTITINTFYLGFVLFRKEQEKQHFTIRI